MDTLNQCEKKDSFDNENIKVSLYRAPQALRLKHESSFIKAVKNKDLAFAELRLYRLISTGPVADDIIKYYIKTIVYKFNATRLLSISILPNNTCYQRSLLEAFALFYSQKFILARDTIDALILKHPDDPFLYHSLWFICKNSNDLHSAIKIAHKYINFFNEAKLSFTFGQASLCERLKNAPLMRNSLSHSYKKALAKERNINNISKDLTALSRFWLNVYDIDHAFGLVNKARSISVPGADNLIVILDNIRCELRGLEPYITQAKSDLMRRLKKEKLVPKAGTVEVVLCSAATTFKVGESSAFRSAIRFAYQQIFKAIEDLGREIVVRSKLDSQTEIFGSSRRTVISYHTHGVFGHSLHFKEAYFPGFITLDLGGYSGWSEVADIPIEVMDLHQLPEEQVDSFFENFLQNSVRKNLSKYAQPDLENVALPASYVFVGLQIINDSVQQLSNLTMLEMLDEVTLHCNSIGLPVVVKRHPFCKSPIVSRRLEQGEQNGEFILSAASVHQLIENSIAVCVVNSGVGLESLFHLKPVYLFGKSDYSHCCYLIRQRGEFSKIFNFSEPKTPALVIKRYLYWLHTYHFIDCRDHASAAKQIKNRVHSYINLKDSLLLKLPS